MNLWAEHCVMLKSFVTGLRYAHSNSQASVFFELIRGIDFRSFLSQIFHHSSERPRPWVIAEPRANPNPDAIMASSTKQTYFILRVWHCYGGLKLHLLLGFCSCSFGSQQCDTEWCLDISGDLQTGLGTMTVGCGQRSNSPLDDVRQSTRAKSLSIRVELQMSEKTSACGLSFLFF